MAKDFFLKQLNDVIDEFQSLCSRSHEYEFDDTREEEITSITSRAKAVVTRIAGHKSEYYKGIDFVVNKTFHSPGKTLRLIMGSVYALRDDIKSDYLKSLSQIIESEVFGDYLEMADHLLSEKYKDPAAVLIGSTLEAHLKKLCIAHAIPIEIKNQKGTLTPKKAEVINADLTKAGVYSTLNQKQVTAWLAIRNSAAHGNYTAYKDEDVKLMLQGVRHFIITVS